MRPLLSVLLIASLTACANQPTRSGFLTRYDGMKPREMVRAKAEQKRGGPQLARLHSVSIEPTKLAPGVQADWLTDDARTALLREFDAQLCFELSERYPIAATGKGDARVRAAVTDLEATGRAGSAASVAANTLIPGPIGVRAPGSTGGVSAEAEMLGRNGRQLAAISWSRSAMTIGSDNPSLTRIGDALQFAEPFADAAAKAMTAPKARRREIEKPDPCAEYGPRFRPEGFLTKLATGLYVPEMSAAKDADTKADAKTDTKTDAKAGAKTDK